MTGSSGDGYLFAEDVGHTVIPPRGSLVPLESDDPCFRQMQGLSLKNVSLRLLGETGKTLYQEQGEMLFTHFGLSGPLVLSASAHLPESGANGLSVSIDLKPALDEKKLDARLLRDLEEKSNANFSTILGGLLPASMVPVMAERVGVSRQTVNAIVKGDYNPTIRLCLAICHALGCTLDALFWEDEA